MDKVAILMATYNGEEFIEKQLESIQAQTYSNWELLIRDDGSTDRTLEIIDEFSKQDSRISLLENNEDFHGAYVNFHYLINAVRPNQSFDYFFFCDQDDIWLPHKLEVTLSHFVDNAQPELVYSDFSRIDETDNLLQADYLKTNQLFLSSPWQLFVGPNSFMLGCTQAFNRALLDIIPEIDMKRNRDILYKLPHDKYFAFFALNFGQVHFIAEPLIHYRLHGSNVTRMYSRRKGLKDYYQFFKRGVRERYRIHGVYISQTLFFLSQIQETTLYSDELRRLEEVLEKGGEEAVRFLWHKRVKKRNFRETLLLYAILWNKGYQSHLLFRKNKL